MIVVRAAALIALVSIGIAGNASARTPTPTGTPTSAPPATATPVPPEPALFNIFPWVNGQEGAHDVAAKIGETICAIGIPGPGAGMRPHFTLFVPSEDVAPGCGREGAVVTFLVDGQQAPQTAIWRSGGSGDPSRFLDVIIGPPFARFSGGAGPGGLSPGQAILPYGGNAPCGHAEAGVAPGYGYEAVVYSAEQQAGCGVEGSHVTFKLLDAQGNVIAVANEKATWHAWDGVSYPQRLDLTFGPAGGIAMPNTGDGPARTPTPWGALALALASLGLAGGIATLALRRRAMTR